MGMPVSTHRLVLSIVLAVLLVVLTYKSEILLPLAIASAAVVGMLVKHAIRPPATRKILHLTTPDEIFGRDALIYAGVTVMLGFSAYFSVIGDRNTRYMMVLSGLSVGIMFVLTEAWIRTRLSGEKNL